MTGRSLGAVVLLGLPGAGKTTLARALAARCGARLVSRDEIRSAMFRPCSFSDAEKAAAFSALLGAVTTNCSLGEVSIVEGMPFSRPGEYEAVAAAAAAQGRSALPILLRIDPAVAAERIAAQRSPGQALPADRDPALPFAVHARFREPPPSTLELDARADPLELLNAAVEQISAIGGGDVPPRSSSFVDPATRSRP
ncbi:MAG: AAA family ATPase [Actinomycetota bacterium]|nr:AAA family ATPase [Actinomycetota bacterium]